LPTPGVKGEGWAWRERLGRAGPRKSIRKKKRGL